MYNVFVVGQFQLHFIKRGNKMKTLVTVYMDDDLDVVFDKFETTKTIPQIIEEVESKTQNWVYVNLSDMTTKSVRYIGFERTKWFG